MSMEYNTNNMLELELPGFRFHPTEEELLKFYLTRISIGKKLRFDFISFLNIYYYEPWELPGLAKIGEREWYFFVQRDRKHSHGGRPNRTTKNGFWKATGSDRQIRCLTDPKSILGVKKTLVYYQGRAPRGLKTDWVMNEYRLPDNFPSPKEDIVLCKIYRKATSLKVLEERAAMEGQAIIPNLTSSSPISQDTLISPLHEFAVETEGENYTNVPSSFEGFGSVKESLKKLEVPKFNMDLTVEPLWALLRSPWLDHGSPYADVLNF